MHEVEGARRHLLGCIPHADAAVQVMPRSDVGPLQGLSLKWVQLALEAHAALAPSALHLLCVEPFPPSSAFSAARADAFRTGNWVLPFGVLSK